MGHHAAGKCMGSIILVSTTLLLAGRVTQVIPQQLITSLSIFRTYLSAHGRKKINLLPADADR